MAKITLTFILISALVFVGSLILRDRPRRIEIDNQIQALENKIMELKADKTALEKIQDYLKSRAALEREARIKFNLKKPDEESVVIKGIEEKQDTVQIEIKKSVIGRIKNWILNLF